MLNIICLPPWSPLWLSWGLSKMRFHAKFLVKEHELQKFLAWAETKTGIFWGRIMTKVRDKDHVCCIFNMQTKIQNKPIRDVVHVYLGFAMDFLMFHVFQTNLILLVRHHQNISNPWQDQFKVGAIVQAWFAKKYQFFCKEDCSTVVLLKIAYCNHFWEKMCSEPKIIFILLLAT